MLPCRGAQRWKSGNAQRPPVIAAGTFAAVQWSSLPLLALLGMLASACSTPEPRPDMTSSHLDHIEFATLNGGHAGLGALEGTKATLYITLDPECPMTLGYVPLLDSLEEALPNGVAMVGLYPAPFIVRDSAAAFARKHHLDFPQVMDPDCHLANALQARVTPEVFLVALSGTVLYRGALDNSAVREGRKRTANEHYLRDALSAFAGGHPQPRAEVKALGCIVECDNTQGE